MADRLNYSPSEFARHRADDHLTYRKDNRAPSLISGTTHLPQRKIPDGVKVIAAIPRLFRNL